MMRRVAVTVSKSRSSKLLTPPTTRRFIQFAHFSTDNAAEDFNSSSSSSRVKIFDRDLKRKHVCPLSAWNFDSNDAVEEFYIHVEFRCYNWLQRDRAAWLMRPNDSFIDAVAENILDRLEVTYADMFIRTFFSFRIERKFRIV